MPNITQNPNMPSNPTYGADTRNLGFQFNGGNGMASKWGDQSNQNSNPNYNFSGQPQQPFNPFSANGGQQNGLGNGLDFQSLIQKQLGSNAMARQQNQGMWDSSSNYLKQFAQPFTPDVVNAMKNESAMGLQGAANNAFRNESGILAAGGQNDASSLAAAQSEASRHLMGAQAGANQDLSIKAALGNSEAGRSVGSSILSNMPQYKPDDYSGLLALTNQMQNQGTFNNILANQYDRPQNPGSSNSRPSMGGGGGVNPMGGGGGGGAGFNWMQPTQNAMRPNGSNPTQDQLDTEEYGPMTRYNQNAMRQW